MVTTMNRASQNMMKAWACLGTRFLPFSDAATSDLPLSRLLQLSLFQVTVGMSLVLLIGTLNRAMIVELGVPASLVGAVISLPLIFAPVRAFIGFRSDTHRSALGWKRVPFMYRGTMVQFGTIASALIFGALLADFTPGRLVQVIQGSAVATIVLNAIALWKQEARGRSRASAVAQQAPRFQQAWDSFIHGGQTMRRMVAIGMGTMAFSMKDVLLEPYGGEILHLGVADTTKLSATLAVGGLLGFSLAARVLGRGADPFRMASYGVLPGVPTFVAVIKAAPMHSPMLFAFGTLLIGFGAGLFGHGTLTATMNLASPRLASPRLARSNRAGLGTCGAVQASAAGLAIALGGIVRDVVAATAPPGALGAAVGYTFVHGIEVVLLFATLVTTIPLIRPARVLARAG